MPSLSVRIIAACAALALTVQPVAAQSILRDAETEALLRDMAAPIVTAARGGQYVRKEARTGRDPEKCEAVFRSDHALHCAGP